MTNTTELLADELLKTMDILFSERSKPINAQLEALVETVRSLAILVEQHARLTGHVQMARRVGELIWEELTSEADRQPVDAFGEPA